MCVLGVAAEPDRAKNGFNVFNKPGTYLDTSKLHDHEIDNLTRIIRSASRGSFLLRLCI